jgi:hypothetical protein
LTFVDAQFIKTRNVGFGPGEVGVQTDDMVAIRNPKAA